MRQEILDFANQMEKVMQAHDQKKGESWKELPVPFLMGKLQEEYAEAVLEFESGEFVDLANICMMLWHRMKKQKI